MKDDTIGRMIFIFACLVIISLAIVLILICSKLIGLHGELNSQLDRNEQEVGLRIYDDERACLDFCLPNEYYFSSGRSSQCMCKGELG